MTETITGYKKGNKELDLSLKSHMCLKFLPDIKLEHLKGALQDNDNIHLMNKSERKVM